MNGQTGKMVGDLPADKGAFWKYVVSRGLVIGVILLCTDVADGSDIRKGEKT